MKFDRQGSSSRLVNIAKVLSGGIEWYVEQRGEGPDIILIPSGEGDCGSFEAVASHLAADFRVTTFDMPGFSRTTVADMSQISIKAMAGQINELAGSLGIGEAVIYGSSSGAVAALDLIIGYPGLARRLVIHEVSLPSESKQDGPKHKYALLDDVGIATACSDRFETILNEDANAWKALGQDYHDRLAVNYPVWVRHYVLKMAEHKPFTPTDLVGKPITWTIGSLFEVQTFFDNVRLAQRAGIGIDTLPCKHFPQVSIPEKLSAHIRSAARA